MSVNAIDQALIGALANDATLSALAPGGVFRGVAPQSVTAPYVIVDMVTAEDMPQLQFGTAFESLLYLVKAVAPGTSAGAAQSAADRVHVLLQNAVLSISGYRCMLCQREERIAYVEINNSSDLRYQHRGGLYRVMVDPA